MKMAVKQSFFFKNKTKKILENKKKMSLTDWKAIRELCVKVNRYDDGYVNIDEIKVNLYDNDVIMKMVLTRFFTTSLLLQRQRESLAFDSRSVCRSIRRVLGW